MKRLFKYTACIWMVMVLAVSSIAYAYEPISGDFVKTTAKNQIVTFSKDDFTSRYIAFDKQTPTSVKFTSVPGWFGGGKLLLNSQKVKRNQEIFIDDVKDLCFQPKKNFTGEVELSFVMQGEKEKSNEAVLTIIISGNAAKQTASQADKSVTIYENSPKEFCVVDGAMKLAEKKVKVVEKPQRGTVDMVDNKTGHLIYAPPNNYIGEDRFLVQVRDAYGNKQTAAVNVTIAENIPAASVMALQEREHSTVVYTDLQQHWAEYSAEKLAQCGVVVGEVKKDNTALFYPNEVMNRAEFYHMLFSTLGIRLENGKKTEFTDCKNEPQWVMQTANTAYQLGLSQGYADGKKQYFKPYNIITRAEAAVAIDALIHPKTVSLVNVDYRDIDLVPSWAEQSVKNMTGYGIFKGSDSAFWPQKGLTRAECAALCYRVMYYEKNLK